MQHALLRGTRCARNRSHPMSDTRSHENPKFAPRRDPRQWLSRHISRLGAIPTRKLARLASARCVHLAPTSEAHAQPRVNSPLTAVARRTPAFTHRWTQHRQGYPREAVRSGATSVRADHHNW